MCQVKPKVASRVYELTFVIAEVKVAQHCAPSNVLIL